MPWYWSDEIARVLVVEGKIGAGVASMLTRMPVAFRSESDTIEGAIEGLMADDEIPPLAA